MTKRSPVFLLAGVAFLIVVGMVMLMSTSIFSADASETDAYREVKKQVLWLILGCGVCWALASIDYRFFQKHVWWFYGATLLLLTFCYIPGIGTTVNNENRWIKLGGAQMQPSEIAKIMLAVILAHWFSMHPDSGNKFLRGFVFPMGIAGVMIALVLFEVDMGTTAVLSASCFVILFVAGVNWKWLTGLVAMGVTGFWGMLKYAPDRMERITAFLDPEKHRFGDAWQQWISLLALGSGGLEGRGIGEGRLKMLYMPFAHTDFIFPMIGEELGLICTLLVVLAFVLIAVSGIAISFHAPDRFGMLLGLGVTCFIVFQACLNIGVTTAVLPNTGLPLPFVSYGGSALLAAMAAIGILLNIFRQGKQRERLGEDWVKGTRITPRL